jgi:glycosyltransferase involved in cell wall biosynthesis
MTSNRYLFIAGHYNKTKTVGRMLMSIGAQSYKDWKIIITDDMSDIFERQELHKQTSHFRDMVDDYFHRSEVDSKLELVINTEKKYETLNVLTMIREHAKPDDIVCRIDCDDYLCDNDALYALNDAYEGYDFDALWTAHRWVDTGDVPTTRNISGPLTDPDVYKSEWRSSHLKTFRAHLLDGINEENFKGEDGNYNRRSGDQALYLPVLHKALKKDYCPMVTYSYRCSLAPERYQTDDARFQKAEAEFIRKRGFVE